jgi:hypothetical protein
MIVSAYLDSVDHTADVIVGGVQSLSYQVEDVEGKLTIPNVTIKFCNLKKSFTNIIPNASINHIALKIGRQDVFQGTLTPDGFLYDPDDERMEIKCIGTENYFVNQLKDVKLSLLPLKRIQKILSIDGGSGAGGIVTVKRFFYSIKDVLNLMIGYAGIDSSISNIQIDESLCVGGLSASATSTVVNKVVIPPLYLPDMTCYDFLVEVVKLLNGVWWIDSFNGFIFYPKTQLIALRRAESPLLMTPIRNTMNRSDEYLGWDQVTFSFKNSSSFILPPGYDYLQWIIQSNISPQKPNAVASIFRNPYNSYGDYILCLTN